jgi:hypothetical protein
MSCVRSPCRIKRNRITYFSVLEVLFDVVVVRWRLWGQWRWRNTLVALISISSVFVRWLALQTTMSIAVASLKYEPSLKKHHSVERSRKTKTRFYSNSHAELQRYFVTPCLLRSCALVLLPVSLRGVVARLRDLYPWGSCACVARWRNRPLALLPHQIRRWWAVSSYQVWTFGSVGFAKQTVKTRDTVTSRSVKF